MSAATIDGEPRSSSAGPAVLTLALLAIAASIAVIELGPAIAALRHPVAGFDPERMVLLYSSLPRLATSLLCGAALAGAGVILQQVMRNPIASDTTLGVSAGANLALALAGVYAPGLFGFGRDLVALVGSAGAVSIVFLLARRQGFAPMALVLAGLVVSLACGALSALLVLLNNGYLVSLFMWGSGSLSLQDWSIPLGLAARLAVLGTLAALLLRPLSLLELEDDGARALGLPVPALRALGVALAVTAAAFVASAVGVIGFVGLLAPTLARLAGARRFRERLVWSCLIGAALLWLTDGAVQALGAASGDLLPTGAATALIGAPLLLYLLSRMRLDERPPFAVQRPAGLPFSPAAILIGLGLALAALVLLSVLVGREASGGWALLGADDAAAVLPWRLPRMTATLAAGAMLATAGAILQRLTGNEMASPELLGIGAGATIGVALALFVFTGLGAAGFGIAAFAGAGVTLLAVLAFGSGAGFAPERVLLAGIAINALIDAVVGILSASGDPRAMLLLSWMGGATSAIDAAKAVETSLAGAGLFALSLLCLRWLAILPLGPVTGRALGLPLGGARLAPLLLAAALTAAATPVLGPYSFVGLMGPHIAGALGLRRPRDILVGSALAGAAVMVAADFAARVAVFPWTLPTGLTAAVIGTPLLLWLLQRKG